MPQDAPPNGSALRHAYGIPAAPRKNVTPAGQGDDVVSITKAAAELGVGIATIYRWLADGFIPGEQAEPGAPWRIRLTSELRAKVTGQAPDGWLPLNQAAAALGMARQTVLQRSSAANSPPSTSATAGEAACVSRSNPISLDYSRNHEGTEPQCKAQALNSRKACSRSKRRKNACQHRST